MACNHCTKLSDDGFSNDEILIVALPTSWLAPLPPPPGQRNLQEELDRIEDFWRHLGVAAEAETAEEAAARLEVERAGAEE